MIRRQLLPMRAPVWTSLTAILFAGVTSAQEDHAAHTQPAEESQQRGTQQQGTSAHVPPDPPAHRMRDMSAAEMIEMMDMDDDAAFFMVSADAFEWRGAESEDAFAWDVDAWYGKDYNKLRLKSEGDRDSSSTQARVEVVWDRVIARWWNLQAGIRHDVGEGPSRTWAAFGVQGLAPYWFEVEATGYVGEEGRTALRLAVDYEVLLSQRLILEPEFEIEVFGKDDRENLIGSGLAKSELALRLRYEFKREFAPYVGVAWTQLHGNTADIARAAGVDADEVEWLVGIRWWF